jgi:mycothiol system anti-sigma-R factor
MSCGKPHETPCTEVLDRVYAYLDGELDAPDIAKIRQHLDECGPCLAEYGLDELVKQFVHNRVAMTQPHARGEKVLIRIQQVAELIVSQGAAPVEPQLVRPVLVTWPHTGLADRTFGWRR